MKLSLDTQRALANGHVTRGSNGWGFVLGEQLDRAAYVEVDKALKALGGKWSRGLKAHLFADDPEEAIDAAVCAGEVRDRRKEWGFFPTPPAVVSRMIAKIERARAGGSALEPSAGTGNLAMAADRLGYDVFCCEIDPKNAALLNLSLGFCVENGDFLDYAPATLLERFGRREGFDLVLMNPPFAKSADVKHVLHALRFLKPGGRLVAVCSAGIEYRRGALYEELRARATIERLPSGSFAESGTQCETVLATVDA